MKRTLVILYIFFWSCSSGNEDAVEHVVAPKPPVTTTTVTYGDMAVAQEFNVYSKYLKKETVRSPIDGYLVRVLVDPGDKVRRGQLLFSLQTQESKALENMKLENDSLFNFNGKISVYSPKEGIISTIDYQQSSYVQKGDQLAQVIPLESMVFIMNVPFEYISDISQGMQLKVELPGNRSINTTVGQQLPLSGGNAQVESFILHPDTSFYIPENLNALVKVKTSKENNVQHIARQAVLSNETQSEFWVMQLINDTTAVRVNISKGMEAEGMVEILSPKFNPNQKILLSGQYGLPDTAAVNVVRQ